MAESIAISIPAFNEAATLESLVQDAQNVLKKYTDDYEILLINDGSKDRTGEIADRLAKQDPRIRVIHHPQNLGFGLTLQKIFSEPKKDWVFFIPGDGQIPAQELDRLWPWRAKADFILGHRVDRQDPWQRKVTAAIYNLLISWVMKRRIYDVDSVVLYRRSLLDKFSLESRSVFLHAEFCLKAAAQGAKVVEVPIEHRPRLGGQAAGNRLDVILLTFKELFRYAFSRKSSQ